MENSNQMEMKKRIVLKMGGKAASTQETLIYLIEEMSRLQGSYQFVFVHGGGAEVSRISQIFGLKPVFRNGIRLTSEAEMEIVDMVLAGKMNKSIVRLFASRGVRAVGISGVDGDLFLASPLEEGSFTGRIRTVNPGLIEVLSDHGYLPVIASVSRDEKGQGLNINADEAALELSRALKADGLLYLSDIPGILKDGSVLTTINETEAAREINGGVITGGMVPKVTSSLEAVKGGVGFVTIGEYVRPGDLAALLEGKLGSRIVS
jgi:acetylglutamate kinase